MTTQLLRHAMHFHSVASIYAKYAKIGCNSHVQELYWSVNLVYYKDKRINKASL